MRTDLAQTGFAALVLWAVAASAFAQAPAPSIVSDGSTGTTVGFSVDGADGSQHYSILDGRFSEDGSNLFHSFTLFSLFGGGDTATFASDAAPQRVIARVTGTSSGCGIACASTINGTLRSSVPGADLYFVNPFGIDFGDGARLDVQGSFHGSTADVVRFDGADFDARNAVWDDGLLQTAAPVAFGFLTPDPASITFGPGDDVGVPAGESFSLVGGDITVFSNDGFGTTGIRAPGGNVQIAAVAAAAEIPLDANGTPDLGSIDPGALEPGTLGGVAIQSGVAVDVSGDGETPAGSIVIRAGRFFLVGGARTGESSLTSVHLLADDAPEAGVIDVAASESIQVRGSRITTFAGSSGDSAAISLVAPDVDVSTSFIETLSFGSGAGGDIHLGGGQVTVRDGALVNSFGFADGPSGELTLTANGLDVRDGGQVGSQALGTGPGGSIHIHADALRVSNEGNAAQGALIFTSTAGAAERGGDIAIEAGSVDLLAGGQINAQTFGSGDAGDVRVDADTVRLEGGDTATGPFTPSAITSRSGEPDQSGATGRGGLISIDTRILEVRDGAQISSATFTAADAGPSEIVDGVLVVRGVEINASERVSVEGGDNGVGLISAASNRNPNSSEVGRGGNLTIQTDVLELRRGGQVTASASGTGDAGDVVVMARQIEISGSTPDAGGGLANPSAIFSRSSTQDVLEGGRGGDIRMEASESLVLSDGGTVSVSTNGTGDSGRIRIDAGESVTLFNGSVISATSLGTGVAGNIDIDAGQVFAIGDSTVTTEATQSTGGQIRIQAEQIVNLVDSSIETSVFQGEGDGGDISIDPEFVLLNRSEIRANTENGTGGNIRITAGLFIASADSAVTAAATGELGVDGEVEIQAPQTTLVGQVQPLPGSFLDAASLIQSACAARTAREGSFVVQATGAVLPPPDAVLWPGDAEGLAAVAAAPGVADCPTSEESP